MIGTRSYEDHFSFQLGCEAQGNTIPEYKWTRNSILVKDWSPNGTYVIRSLSKDDAGQYACSATSEAGTILSDPIELVVKGQLSAEGFD